MIADDQQLMSRLMPKHQRACLSLSSILVAAALTGSPASAQSVAGWSVGASASANLIVGSASDFLDSGFGVDGTVSHGVARHLSVRADGMLIRLAAATNVNETAGNTMFIFGLGPEFYVSLSAVTLYARPLVGLAANVQSRTNSALVERTTWAGVLGGGGGLRLNVAPTVTLELGGDVVKLGELDFARTAALSLQLIEDPTVLRVHLGLRLHVP